MKRIRKRASSGSSVVQREVEQLVREIRKAHRRAARRGDPGCAELEEALARAEAVQKLLEAAEPLKWGKFIGVATFLLELTKWICSSLNCTFTRTRFNGYWFNHIPDAPSRILVPIRVG